MRRVTGIGGIFLKAKDPEALRAWYRRHLGFDVQDWGGVAFRWHEPGRPNEHGSTVRSVMPQTSDYFAPGEAAFMVNYRADDLHALPAVLCGEGCDVDDKVEESEYGRFGRVMDPEGNPVALWEPPPGPLP